MKVIGCNAGSELTCQNGAVCLSNGSCSCITGFTGQTCASCKSLQFFFDFMTTVVFLKLVIGCNAGGSLQCRNGATCSSNGSCICSLGFIGTTCSNCKL